MVFVSLSVFNPPFPPRESFTYHNSRSQCGKMSIKWFPIFFSSFTQDIPKRFMTQWAVIHGRVPCGPVKRPRQAIKGANVLQKEGF